MWNELIGLLGVRHESAEERREFISNLQNLNDWALREYPALTCEEIRRAYNMAVKGELDVKVFPILAPKYFAEIITAYRKKLESDPDYNKVFSQQLLLDTKSPEPDENQVRDIMRSYYLEALETVRSGDTFADPGNGLFAYLEQIGLLKPTGEEVAQYKQRAREEVKLLLVTEKQDAEKEGGLHRISQVRHLKTPITLLVAGRSNQDLDQRIIAHAKYLYLNDYLKKQIDNELSN